MRKFLFTLVTAALVLAGCAVTETTVNENEEASVNQEEVVVSSKLRSAFGSDTTFKTTDVVDGVGSVQANTTMVGIVLDENDTIVNITFDLAQTTVNVEDGKLVEPESIKTKRELGDDYGIHKVSTLGLDWWAQVNNLEANLVGRNVYDVINMELDEGFHAVDADILAGTTIKMTSFLPAIEKAMNSVSEVEGATNSILGATTELTLTDVSEEADGSVQFNTIMAYALTDEAGAIVSSYFDIAQNKVALNAEGVFTVSEDTRTKKEKGPDYGMAKGAASGLEWDEQTRNFEALMAGKSIDEALNTPLEDGYLADADAKAGTSYHVNVLIDALEHATANSKEF